jgi:flagellar export protein FliJ
MPFRFPLETLLRLRTTLTRQEEVRLESISHQLSAAQQQRQAMQERLRAFDEALAADMRQGTNAGELQLRMAGRRGLLQADERLKQTITQLELAWQQQRQKFYEARQREEVLQNVRERELASFQEEQRRRDQQITDDLFLARRNREL